MPNWCDNQITITGPNSVIDKIEKIVKDEDSKNGLLNYFHPMPAELRDTTADGSKDKKMIKKYGHSDWYSWACENWSTKWDISEFYGVDRQYLTEQSEGESVITFGFSSAWAPPIGAYEKFLADHEDCSLRAFYYEGGCDFMGIWDNFDDNEYNPSDYKSDDAFWDKGIGKQLDEDFAITESMSQWEEEQKEEESA